MIHRTQTDGLPIGYQFHTESESLCEDYDSEMWPYASPVSLQLGALFSTTVSEK